MDEETAVKTIRLLLGADPNEEKDALTRRLTEYLKNLRKTRLAKELIGDDWTCRVFVPLQVLV